MPTYTVKDPQTGRSVKLKGDSPPTEAELIEIFATLPTTAAAPADFRTTNAKDASGNAVVDPNTVGTFARHVGTQINPLQIGQMLPFPKAAGGAGWDAPLQAARNIGGAHQAVAEGAKAAYDEGDYVTAGRKAISYLLPVIGPVLDKSADAMQKGDYAAGLGDAVGLALAMFGGKPAAAAVSKVKAGLPRIAPNLNRAEAAAVQFGEARGIPVDAATATGNRFVRATQAVTEHTPIGGVIAERAKASTADALRRVSGELADEAHHSPVMPEQAGQGVRDAVTGNIQQHHATASTAYDGLRTIEADPVRASTMAVNVAPAKASLQSLYTQLRREAELVPLQGGKARALVALDRLMSGPDSAPLSVVDAALGDLKAMARGADLPELRSQGQGVAAAAVKELDAAVRQTATRAGPDALTALERGRNATVQKYQSADVLDSLRNEPVQAYRDAVQPKDSGVARLRTIMREAPKELPKIARAYLEDLFGQATAEGGFDKGARLQAEWQKLGPETKRILFPKAGQTAALDQFFLLTKKLQEPANSSKTALVTSAGVHGALILTNPLTGIPLTLASGVVAKLMHSPRAVRMLTRSTALSLSKTTIPQAVRAAAYADLVKAAHEVGVNLSAVPKAADRAPEPER